MIGGAGGVTARYLITQAAGPGFARSLVTMIINVVGSILLGVLLESLARRGPDRGRRRTLRLLLGTGVLGGFTTYSTLAVDVTTELLDGRLLRAVAIGFGSLVLGLLGAAAGVVWAGRRHRGSAAGEVP